ncbi:hypothetical protein LYNGBM3L_00120 [Moorena producens 3L]|uniref:Uncharacterized protein n=1 Tax=Moorena producens 3L TaxID=489825 RepID=F4XI20_9CYAN|nr:hypothetical protein LYNGBM3L_00120 [Moorena producens 3L]
MAVKTIRIRVPAQVNKAFNKMMLYPFELQRQIAPLIGFEPITFRFVVGSM